MDNNNNGDRVVARRIEIMAKIIKGRINYLAAVALTILNSILYLFSTGIELPFYLSIPYYLLILGKSPSKDDGKPTIVITFLIGWGVLLVLSAVLFFLTKKSGKWFKVITGYLIVDSLFVILLGVYAYLSGGGFSPIFTLVLNLAYHIWVIVYSISASRAEYALT
ncbi:MAG: hypothetical protein J5850_01835, partial [Clostridia bacterium]|nr:hypothetical protein [Clostridia bacterium]